jgi:TonB-linked SusC/RagA family outer membrane protein
MKLVHLTQKGVVLFALLLLGISGFAQRNISGVVTDEDGESLPGASVKISGSTVGTVTDIDGKFKLSVPNDVSNFEVSMVGMETQVVVLRNRNDYVVTLASALSKLGNVVIIGYGEQQKKDVTGSVSSVKGEVLRNQPLPSVDQLLQGRAAGVVVTQNSGQPGSSASVRIRGITSLTGSNEPLYVIDGVQVSGDGQRVGTSGRADAAGFQWSGGGNGQTAISPLSSLNPSDIESIDILKDASAQAIYGARAANGVIIITTKRGKSGESKVSYDAYVGAQTPARLLETLNLQDYAVLQNDLSQKFGRTPRPEFADPSLLGEGTNWQEEIFQNALMQNHQLGVSGGNDRLNYYLSAGYLDQDGMVIGSGFKRYAVRLNVDNQAKSWWKLGATFTASRTDERITLNDDVEGVITRAVLQGPDVPVRNPDGTYGGPPPNAPEAPQSNPVAQALEIRNQVQRNKFFGGLYSEMKLGKLLTYRAEVNSDLGFRQSPAFRPTYQWGTVENTVASGTNGFDNSQWWSFNNYLTFKHTIGKSNMTAMVGHEAQESRWRGLSGVRARFPSNDLPVLSLGDPTTAANGEYKGSSALESYFGRVIYGFDNRYSLTATLRADGSSKFARGRRWGYFPAVSAAWTITNEKFMQNVKALSNLKIRGGYGEVGNQDVPNYLYGVALNQAQSGLGVGFSPDKIANEQLRWESATQVNIGLDAGLFNNRIEMAVDVYRKRSKDFLYQLPLPDYLGVSGQGNIGSPWVNLGEMENTGIDLTLTTRNIVREKASWTSTLVFSHYKNEVLDIQNLPLFEKVQFGFFTVTNTTEGQPIGQFWGMQSLGLFRDSATLNGAPTQFGRTPGTGYSNMALGDLQFQDTNGDGKVDDTDATFIGSPHPKFTFGFNNSIRYGSFDLSFFLQGAYGAKALNFFRRYNANLAGIFNNQLAEVRDYYDIEAGRTNTETPRPVPGDDNPNLKVSSRYVEDASYLRIQNLTLGYSIPMAKLRRLDINRFKVYASVQNLRTFTKYSGLDPEIGNYNQKATLANVDNGRYPLPRTYTFGVNVEF